MILGRKKRHPKEQGGWTHVLVGTDPFGGVVWDLSPETLWATGMVKGYGLNRLGVLRLGHDSLDAVDPNVWRITKKPDAPFDTASMRILKSSCNEHNSLQRIIVS